MTDREQQAGPQGAGSTGAPDDEREMLKLIDERDAAEEALSQAYYLIVGESPEWSNHFGHAEALERIDDAQTVLRKAAGSTGAPLDQPTPETEI